MPRINIIIKSNGYSAPTLQRMISTFESAAENLFPGCTVRHFYYGDHLDMAEVVLLNGDYGYFNITANRVSFNIHCGDSENIRKFEYLTYHDECFDGKLFKLADKKEVIT